MRAPANFAQRIAALLLAPLLAGSAAAADSAKPRDDVAQMIMIMDGPRDKNCTERKIVKTETLDASQTKTGAAERWTLDRCGKTIHYLVKYAKGGKDFDVQFEK